MTRAGSMALYAVPAVPADGGREMCPRCVAAEERERLR